MSDNESHEHETDEQKESSVPQPSQATQMVYPPAPLNVKSVPFSVLVGLYETLASERKPEKRRKAISSWFSHWRDEVGNDFFPVLRLLLPQKDRERAIFGLKEKNLARVYIKLIPLGMRDPDSIRLLNWKRPTVENKTSGDFPTVLYEVVSKRSSVIEGSLTIDDVNQILDELSKNIGKQDLQSKLLQRVYNNTTSNEQRWIARIILKDMQISVKENTILSVFHPDALDLFNTCSDLKKVAWDLWDTSYRLNDKDKSIQLFRAFSPMLCRRPGTRLEDSIKDMEGRPFIIEEKLDGERIQLHKRGNEYYYCSRKGKDYTYLYGSHVGTGSLTPYIDKAFDKRIEEIILDGEMLVWDPVSQRYLPFGSLKTAALNKSRGNINPRPCFKIFDLLYLNGMSLTGRSVKFRKRNLRAYVKEVDGRMQYITEHEGRTVDDVKKKLNEVMSNRGEGLVLKHPNSEYVLNGRNKDWVKVKPEYMDSMGETVDVLVVAGQYGTGKRSGGVSTLVCAVLDDRKALDDGSEVKYCSFVRIGTGLTFADYVWIRQKNWKPFDINNIPNWYHASRRASEDKGDVYLEPEDSFILKVKAAEIVPSDQYGLGFTMRFPRALAIRDDLSITDCVPATTVLENMKTVRKRKMEEESVSGKKTKMAKKVSVMPEYRGAAMDGLQVTSDLFEGLKFVVSSDPRSRESDEEKKELQKIIHVNGGKILQVVKGIDPIFVVYGGTSTPYDLRLIMNNNIHDIIRPSWIYDCIKSSSRVPLKRKYFFHATSDRKLEREYNMDPEGEDIQSTPSVSSEVRQVMSDASSQSGGKAVRDDSTISEWVKTDDLEDTKMSEEADGSETETDPDSEYEERLDWENDADDWISSANTENEDHDEATLPDESAEQTVQMGEDEAMEYDSEKIFRHLCFYLDSPRNARRNGMEVKAKYEEQIATSFDAIEEVIVANGGRIVELDEPKLTHVVIDKRDVSRRKELMKRTSKPKHRNLILADFIQACLGENTLLDEDGFAP